MTDCADSTTLRAHLDHPDATLDAHLDACGACSGLLRSVAGDAGFTRQALALLDPPHVAELSDGEVEAALAAAFRVEGASARVVPIASRSHRFLRNGRRLVLSGAAALMVLVLGLTPAGSVLANVLDVFRGERLQIVTVDFTSWAASIDPERARILESLGEVDMSGLTEPEEVADVAEAEAVAGITAPAVADPPDVLVALAPGTVRLVLVARDGNGVPAELDGAALVVEVPGAIGAVYGPADSAPEIVVGRSGPLVVRAEGAPLEAIRSFILSREELPADLRAQLAVMGDWRSTIPVPVPVDGPGWQELEVAGRPAVAFGDDSGLGALVLRQDLDGVTIVVGRIGVSRALELAAGA